MYVFNEKKGMASGAELSEPVFRALLPSKLIDNRQIVELVRKEGRRESKHSADHFQLLTGETSDARNSNLLHGRGTGLIDLHHVATSPDPKSVQRRREQSAVEFACCGRVCGTLMKSIAASRGRFWDRTRVHDFIG